MRVLVTGGAGFIGSHVVRGALAEGYEVRVLDNLSTGHQRNLDAVSNEIDFVKGDIREPAVVERATRGCDAVVHLAAVPSVPRSIADPATSHDANATGTLNVLMAARNTNASRVVCASSSSIYGANPALPKIETMQPLPISPYAVSKLAAESYCRSFYEVYGLEAVALRYFNVFGPRQDPQSEYAAVVPKFIWAFHHGEPPVIFGDGEQSRDFTYVANVVDANLAALWTDGIGGRIYNIACGERTSLNTLALTLREHMGADVVPVHGPDRAGDVKHSLADISQARTDLGFEPGVSISEGLRRTVEFYVEQYEATSDPTTLVPVRELESVPTRPARQLPARTAHRNASRRYLITGGAGFIGSHLTERLLAEDDRVEVTILDDLSTGSLSNLIDVIDDDRVRFVEGSATDAQLVDDLMQGKDVCVHLASAVGVQMIVNEPLGTLMRSVRGSNVVMYSAQRHNARVLFSSTSEVYGKQTNGALTEQSDLVFGSPAKGRWTYAIAKSFGEALVHGYHRQRGVDTTVVRLFNTVGPRQTGAYGMVLPRFAAQALRGEDLTIYGNGTQTRCFTHVNDTVSALTKLCHCEEAKGQTFNIGSATPVAVLELARRVIERSGSSSGVVLVPYEQAYGEGFEELGSRRPDTSALRELTGWQPNCTVDDAIDDVVADQRVQLNMMSTARAASGAA